MAPMADGATWDSLGRYALRLAAAAAVGFLIARAYRASTRRPPASLDRHATTLVLLTVLVAMTALVVDDSIARAFSLVGALAIVRFRTILEDTRDTAFVVFAVVSGMAIGVGNWMLTVVGVPLVALVALGLGFLSAGRAGTVVAQQLVVRLGGGRDPEGVVGATLRKHATSWQLKRTTTVRQGAALELTYRLEMRDDGKPIEMVSELNGLESVQHVELGEA